MASDLVKMLSVHPQRWFLHRMSLAVWVKVADQEDHHQEMS
jgi:hypothetical protein